MFAVKDFNSIDFATELLRRAHPRVALQQGSVFLVLLGNSDKLTTSHTHTHTKCAQENALQNDS